MSRGAIKDLTGQRFGRLVVQQATEKRRQGCVIWLCICDCGKQVEAKSGALQSGNTKSCGCLRSDSTKRTKTIHGRAHTRIAHVWTAMNQRCFNQSNKSYPDYGGRGIAVCDEWRDSFEAFYDYVSKLPHFGEPGYSLDRINNEGNYEPGNIRWATRTEQSQNRRNSMTATYNGETRTIKEWADVLQVSYDTIYHRVKRGKSIMNTWK